MHKVVAKVIRCLMVAVFIAAWSAVSFGEVLVYDGFASSAYNIAEKGTGTLSSYPKAYDNTMIGFSEKVWQMNGSQPQVWGYGLNFPSSFSAAGIAAKGEWSIGPNGGGTQMNGRDTSREFTSKLLNKTSGSLYFRLLMHLDKTAATMLPTTSDTIIEGSDVAVNYWGVGFSPQYGTGYNMLNTPNGAFGFFFRKNKAGNISVIFRGKGADGTKVEHELCAVPAANTGLRDDNTYIAYARIDINAGAAGGDVIFAGAQNITTYSPDAAGEAFSQSLGELDLFNDTVYPNTLVYDGCYQTNGKVLFDEIGVATTAEELLDIEMPVPVDPDDFDFSTEITLGDDLKAAIGSGEEGDFPVLVRLSESGISGFKYSDFMESDYSDLAFTDDNGKFLDYEVDTWDPSGTSLVWVRVPSLTSSTKIVCRYGGPKYKHNASKTWANYVGVWHMNEASGNAQDSTSHGYHAVPSKNSGYSGDPLVDMVGADGVLGKSRLNSPAEGQKRTFLSVPKYSLKTSGTFTFSGWYRLKGQPQSSYGRPASSKKTYNDGHGFEIELAKASATSMSCRGASGTSVSVTVPNLAENWAKLVWVYNGATVSVYCNGEKLLSNGAITKADEYYTLSIGANNDGSEWSWYGWYDEVHLYDGVLSDARIKLEHLFENSETAMSYAAVVAPDPELPRLKDCEAVANDAGNIVVSGKLIRHAAAVEVTLSAEGRTPIVVSLGDIEDGGTFERELGEDDGLLRFVDYTVTITAKNGEKVSEKGFADPVKYGKAGPGDYVSKFTATPSDAVRELLGSDTYADFPVLVRIPAAASEALETGREIMVRDETDAELSWELETLNPVGQSFLWVKVPSLSASTVLTVYVGGIVNGGNDPTDVWSRYVGVWHFAPSCAGGTTVPDATGNGFDAIAAGGVLTEYAGPWGNGAIFSTAIAQAPDYDEALDSVAVFSASGWFKLPNYGGGSSQYANIISKKTGLTWNEDKGWYVQMNQSKTTAGLVCASSESKYSSLSDVTANWHHLQVVSDGSKVKVYFDGKTTPDITMTYVVKASGTTLSIGSANSAVDEYRVRNVVSSAAEVALEYKTMKDVDFFEYGEVGPADPTAPVLSKPVIFINDDGTFTVEETIDGNMPKEGSVKIHYHGAVIPMSTIDIAVPALYTALVTPAAENITDVLEIRAKSTVGGERVVTSSGFYNGELKIEKLRDASEKGLSNGVWRISRADAAHDLNVSLVRLDTSTAAAGVDYVEFPLSAAIPDGTNTVDVLLTPIMNLDKDFDTWVDLALTNGAYKIDPAKSFDRCTIINYEIPAGGNIWCATAPGKASVGSNWTSGTAPDETDAVVFDGDVSQADCEWDIDAAHKVKSWTQNANYHGTVTIDTTFDDEFPELVIYGDVIIGGGKWTHKGNYANFGGTETYTSKIDRKYRIAVRIAGDFYLASSTSIDVTGRGWGYLSGKSGNAPCHGGWSDTMNWGQDPYGDYLEPIDLGTGTASQGDQTKNGKSALGGGSVKLIVGGIADLKGDVLADGTGDKCVPRSTGTGGSVWITAKQISGDGRISTSSCPKAGNLTSDQAVGLGSGGRMALYTEEPLAKSRDKLFCSGVAYAETGSSSTKISGPGTIFIKDSTMSAGMLYVKQPSSVCGLSNVGSSTPVTGNWAFDKIILSGAVQLRVLPGFSLSIPSFDAIEVEGNTTAKAAIAVPFGAQFNFGAGNVIVKTGLALMTDEYTIDGNLTLEKGAKIGAPDSFHVATALSASEPRFKMTVTGNVTIPEGASGGMTRTVVKSGSVTSRYGAHGGQSLWSVASSQAYASTDGGFDSIINPSMAGYAQSGGLAAGGAFMLEVGGTLYLDGTISADGGNPRGNDGTYDKSSAGAGGTINITAGSLVGKGSLSADGGCERWSYAGGAGGGRIAVCLTDEDAEFSDRWVNSIRAMGISFTSASANARAGSAGTVYLVDGSQAFDHGTIYVRNDMSFARADLNTAVTCIPGVDETCDNPVMLANTSLYLDGAARVKLTSSFGESILKVVNKTKLDLAGMKYTVRRAYVNGQKVPIGTYQSGDDPFGDILADSVGGGSLRVSGYGLWVFVQ